jgi:hypothetical protein
MMMAALQSGTMNDNFLFSPKAIFFPFRQFDDFLAPCMHACIYSIAPIVSFTLAGFSPP